jgi:activator of 2-hydroxyglutaryl-CoA dehydratase
MEAADQEHVDDDFELATDEAIAACDGDARATVTVLLVANAFLEEQLLTIRQAVSTGYGRQKIRTAKIK